MLNRLPNELLVNILSKTKKKTIAECRLLNYHFDNIIKRYELHKEDMEMLTIGELCPREKFKIYINGREKGIIFDDYEEFLKIMPHFVNKIRKLTYLKLLGVNINIELLNVLLEEKCFLKLKGLKVQFCQLEINAGDKWFAFLNKLQLDELSSTARTITIPRMMLRRGNKKLKYCDGYDFFDMTWLDDNVLDKWFSDEKKLRIDNCQTALTVNGVIKCIQKYLIHRESYEVFGILMDTDQQLIENALTEAKIEWWSEDETGLIDYFLTKIGDREIYVEISCKSTENEDDMEDEDEEEFEQNEE